MSDDKTRVSTDQGEHYVALPAGFMLGKYRLDSVLGQGGFGITYKAWDSALNRTVAIKEYLPADVAVRIDGTTVSARSRNDADSFDWGLQRFLEEARALARFEDAPSIVRVHDYLQAHGTAYMVMALIDGTPLSTLYKREAPLSEARLKSIVLPLLDGLQHVHQAGFLHRDIKPANILIRANGQPVLIDFGAARQALGDKSRSMTSVFTPGYAPFEQYSSTGRQGPWTDIYALAATLYHGVTGQIPVSAADRIPQDPLPPSARVARGRYARSFLAAIDHGLGVFEADRPKDVGQWGRMLRGEIPVPPPRPPPQAASRPLSKRRLALVAGGAAAAIVAVIGLGIAALPAGMLADVAPFLSSETAEQRAQRLAEQARQAVEEAQRAQNIVEAEARRRAAEEARLKAEAEARLKAEEEARRQAAEAQRRIEAAARARDEEAQRKAEAEAQRLAEEQRQRQRLIEEQLAARQAAEEARKKAEAELAEAQRQTAEAQRQADALRRQAEQMRAAAEAEAQKRAEAEARAKAEAETRRKAEEEAKAKAKADAEAKRKAEADAKAEAEARRKAEAEAKKKADLDAKARAEAEDRKKQEETRQPAQQAANPAPAAVPGAAGDTTRFLVGLDPLVRQTIESEVRGRPDLYGNDSAQFTIVRFTQRSLISSRPGRAEIEVDFQGAVQGAPTGNLRVRLSLNGYPDNIEIAKLQWVEKGRLVAAAAPPRYAYAGNWTWTITCPELAEPRFYTHFTYHRIEGESFNWTFGAGGSGASGQITGNRMSFRQNWVTGDGTRYSASFALSAAGTDSFSGSGFVSGFTAAARDRACTIKMDRTR